MLDSWKKRAYADPKLKWKHARIIEKGPKSLSEAWILGAMKLRYSYEFGSTTGNVEER